MQNKAVYYLNKGRYRPRKMWQVVVEKVETEVTGSEHREKETVEGK